MENIINSLNSTPELSCQLLTNIMKMNIPGPLNCTVLKNLEDLLKLDIQIDLRIKVAYSILEHLRSSVEHFNRDKFPVINEFLHNLLSHLLNGLLNILESVESIGNLFSESIEKFISLLKCIRKKNSAFIVTLMYSIFEHIFKISTTERVHFTARRDLLLLFSEEISQCDPNILKRNLRYYESNLKNLFEWMLFCGDYQLQEAITFVISHHISKSSRGLLYLKQWASNYSKVNAAISFLNLYSLKSTRNFLNQVNKLNLSPNKVYTLPCISIFANKDVQLFPPMDPNFKDFWIDFSSGTQIIHTVIDGGLEWNRIVIKPKSVSEMTCHKKLMNESQEIAVLRIRMASSLPIRSQGKQLKLETLEITFKSGIHFEELKSQFLLIHYPILVDLTNQGSNDCSFSKLPTRKNDDTINSVRSENDIIPCSNEEDTNPDSRSNFFMSLLNNQLKKQNPWWAKTFSDRLKNKELQPVNQITDKPLYNFIDQPLISIMKDSSKNYFPPHDEPISGKNFTNSSANEDDKHLSYRGDDTNLKENSPSIVYSDNFLSLSQKQDSYLVQSNSSQNLCPNEKMYKRFNSWTIQKDSGLTNMKMPNVNLIQKEDNFPSSNAKINQSFHFKEKKKTVGSDDRVLPPLTAQKNGGNFPTYVEKYAKYVDHDSIYNILQSSLSSQDTLPKLLRHMGTPDNSGSGPYLGISGFKPNIPSKAPFEVTEACSKDTLKMGGSRNKTLSFKKQKPPPPAKVSNDYRFSQKEKQNKQSESLNEVQKTIFKSKSSQKEQTNTTGQEQDSEKGLGESVSNQSSFSISTPVFKPLKNIKTYSRKREVNERLKIWADKYIREEQISQKSEQPSFFTSLQSKKRRLFDPQSNIDSTVTHQAFPLDVNSQVKLQQGLPDDSFPLFKNTQSVMEIKVTPLKSKKRPRVKKILVTGKSSSPNRRSLRRKKKISYKEISDDSTERSVFLEKCPHKNKLSTDHSVNEVIDPNEKMEQDVNNNIIDVDQRKRMNPIKFSLRNKKKNRMMANIQNEAVKEKRQFFQSENKTKNKEEPLTNENKSPKLVDDLQDAEGDKPETTLETCQNKINKPSEEISTKPKSLEVKNAKPQIVMPCRDVEESGGLWLVEATESNCVTGTSKPQKTVNDLQKGFNEDKCQFCKSRESSTNKKSSNIGIQVQETLDDFAEAREVLFNLAKEIKLKTEELKKRCEEWIVLLGNTPKTVK